MRRYGVKAGLRNLKACHRYPNFVLGPLGQRLPGFRKIHPFITENRIKATAIFYTDIEEFALAEQSILDAMRFSPASGAFGHLE